MKFVDNTAQFDACTLRHCGHLPPAFVVPIIVNARALPNGAAAVRKSVLPIFECADYIVTHTAPEKNRGLRKFTLDFWRLLW